MSIGLWIIRATLLSLAVVTGATYAHDAIKHSEASGLLIESTGEATPWTHLQINNNPSAFQFAIVTDRTGGLRPGVFSEAVDKLNLLQPEFVVSVGDLIEGYTEDRQQLASEWNEFDSMVARLDMPFFYLAGNHDYTNDVMAEVWRERYGKSYYHFTYRDVMFVMLNSNDGGSTHSFSGEQIDWLKKTLNENKGSKWTLIFTHAPLWDRDEQDRWGEVEALLQDRPYTVFAGHHHRYVRDKRHGREYFTLATTGGVSSMRGARFGEFDHVVWVTMSEDGPIIANLMLDGIWDKNVRTAEMRDLQNNMIDRGRVSAPAILYRDRFSEGTAQLRLKNDADIAYAFSADISSLGGALVERATHVEVQVPPNEIVTIPVPLRVPKAMSGNTNLAQVDWQLRYDLNGESIEYQGEEMLAAAREYPLPKLKGFSLDAELSEWSSTAFFANAPGAFFTTENFSGDEDFSFRWSAGVTDKGLVLAVDVVDDDIKRDESQNYWVQDFLFFNIDAREKSRRSIKQTYDNKVPGDRSIAVVAPAAGFEALLRGNPGVPEGVELSAKVTDRGYAAEVYIPFTVLEADRGGKWDGLRINVQARDNDSGEYGMVGREWLPSWGHESVVAGSGNFYRQSD
ncbi:metallophosphoesterase [Gilvimarinus sp. SDUM040013]|uniref:Metallophosphoesterase n=1 Tax=Gilvimarinus gilvus TaxID=3058038 RepID=A0ABU4RZ59_9GAMM|nr:metallophosphoesterase [Gilvimarinus sp. SDUM040013]MDO3384579.1 metallophosphoesterase [Gilvimarinus sp. SDUM040013]MDX6850085.1 metallophosphoesterase [Gilvimarinus sp. SDUM040013]